MWPFVLGVFRHRGQGVAFEAAGDEELSTGYERVGIGVIGASIGDQGGRDFGRRGKIRATNDK